VTMKLGAFGADLAVLAGFFAPPWEKPVASITKAYRAFVLSCAGFDLRALGRLKDAFQPMRVSLDLSMAHAANAAKDAGNLSELQLALGDVGEAIAFAEQSVGHADRSGDAFVRLIMRTTLADALHHAGKRARAQAFFEEAERLQAEHSPEYPRLPGLQGYRYCELLLSSGRHAEVHGRAAYAIEIDLRSNWLLAIALDRLSLGRADLLAYEADRSGDLAEAEGQLNQAVDGLRKAGQIHHLPRGHLARAECFRITEQYDRARRDLDEAMRIATRSGMRLHECDAHLELARLALAEGEPDAARDHLGHAAGLVQQTGYHRRDAEVKKLRDQLGEPS
jgi:tetratricopeptide (TPR) repeat protein